MLYLKKFKMLANKSAFFPPRGEIFYTGLWIIDLKYTENFMGYYIDRYMYMY